MDNANKLIARTLNYPGAISPAEYSHKLAKALEAALDCLKDLSEADDPVMRTHVKLIIDKIESIIVGGGK